MTFKNTLICAFLFLYYGTSALAKQPLKAAINDDSLSYRQAATLINVLAHTDLAIRFDYAKKYAYGKATLHLKPYFYATDSLILDAKGMDIARVALISKKDTLALAYNYNKQQLRIQLDKTYQAGQKYLVFIEYTAKPDELPSKGNQAITNDKGLYFINPDGKDLNKPTQIWTQGQIQATSCWLPTIDQPNQKMTTQISMTVANKYVTLSNGKLIKQRKLKDSLRTDTWRMDLPHAPYLVMMAVGDFKIYRDKSKLQAKKRRSIPVDYYLEPTYAPFAKQIFGNTPEMILFFGNKLGVPFPWNKYAQIVVRDYVSGAMENTTATLHGEFVQQTAREMVDGYNESIIAHELMHHWFGDYTTSRSWGQLSLNESFAAFAEIMWDEYKYGSAKAAITKEKKLRNYLVSMAGNAGNSPALIRSYFQNPSEMFDRISYDKGACILYMLRDQLGEKAFYQGLKLFLTQHAFKPVQADQLRLAFEEITGQDLSAFFDQWFFTGGHPILLVTTAYDHGQTIVTIKQMQDKKVQRFALPIVIDTYIAGRKTRHYFTMQKTSQQSFVLPFSEKPDLIVFDPEKILVSDVIHHKTAAEYIHQFDQSKQYIHRLEALEYAFSHLKTEEKASKVIQDALKDPDFQMRLFALQKIDAKNSFLLLPACEFIIEKIAETDANTLVRAAALSVLSFNETNKNRYEPLFRAGLKADSYAIVAASLIALASQDSTACLTKAQQLQAQASGKLLQVIATLYADYPNQERISYLETILKGGDRNKIYFTLSPYLSFMARINHTDSIKRGIDLVQTLCAQKKNEGMNQDIAEIFRRIETGKQALAEAASDRPLDKSMYLDQVLLWRQAADNLTIPLSGVRN